MYLQQVLGSSEVIWKRWKRPLPTGQPHTVDSHLQAPAGVRRKVLGSPGFWDDCLFWLIQLLQRLQPWGQREILWQNARRVAQAGIQGSSLKGFVYISFACCGEQRRKGSWGIRPAPSSDSEHSGDLAESKQHAAGSARIGSESGGMWI